MIFRRRRKPESVRHAPRCSFCGKERGAEGGGGRRVEMVAGPGVYICSDCISLCNEILNRRGHTPPTPA